MKITTRQQLEAHIKSHKGKDVPLFTAYGEYGFISDDTLKTHRKITIGNSRETGNPFILIDGESEYSLHDRHIDYEQSYNNNWWFTTEEEAKEYAGVTDK